MGNTKEILYEVGQFFKKLTWKNCLTFSVFLFLSTIFWLAIVYKENLEMEFSIPVKYEGVPDSIIFENELPAYFNVNIKDKGATLMQHYPVLRENRDSILINLSGLFTEKNSSQRIIIQNENIVQLVREKLQAGTELISYSPSIINASYAVMRSKQIPVVYDDEIELAQGFIFNGETTTLPDKVTIYATQRALDTIFFAHTDISEIGRIDQSKNIRVPLKSIEGARLKPDSVTLSISVDNFSTKEMSIPITCINLPDDLTIKFFPSHAKVKAAIGLRKYKSTKDSEFKIVVDYNKIKNLNSSSIPIMITGKPEHALIQSFEPGEVEFVLEKTQ